MEEERPVLVERQTTSQRVRVEQESSRQELDIMLRYNIPLYAWISGSE